MSAYCTREPTTRANGDRGRHGAAWQLVAAALILAAFAAARTALLLTSYDANHNWEEPVFLFSATELLRDGMGQVFAHQDDLNHGGSVVLLLLAVPWVSLLGTSMVTLKGVAIVWATLTLTVLMTVAWRYFSPTVALLLGTFYLALSPTLARLDVTLVGSHPEAVLPCTLALGCYLAAVSRRAAGAAESAWISGALGLAAGVAMWVAYVSAMFVLPVVALHLLFARSRRAVAATGVGLLAGALPWAYQNLWLHPHGAIAWLAYLGPSGGTATSSDDVFAPLAVLAGSFGYPPPGGGILLGLLGGGLGLLWAAVLRRRWPGRLAASPAALLPFALAPVLGAVMLAWATLPLRPNEGYYHARFFVPMQVSLFWTLALAVDFAASSWGRGIAGAAVVAALLAGVWGQAPLFGAGNTYEPDFEKDRLDGCEVFGIAEWDRSGDAPGAIARLAVLSDPVCRQRAFAGLGWPMARRLIDDRNVEAARATLDAIGDRRLRFAACGGVLFYLDRSADSRLTPAARNALLQHVSRHCRSPRA